MANFSIVKQVKKVKGVEVEVDIKKVEWRPQELEDGTIKFVPVGQCILQVLVGFQGNSDKAQAVKLKWNSRYKDIHLGGKWTIQQPDALDYPKIYVGEGKHRRQQKDMLSPMVKVDGVREEFNRADEFFARVERMTGPETSAYIRAMFDENIAEAAAAVNQPKKKARKRLAA